MKISYNWLRTYIESDHTAEEYSQILTSIGLEVESLERVEQIEGGLEGVVTGEVVESSRHPNADRLTLTKVSIGDGELLPIVCGAPNVAVGQKVMVATVGTSLPTADGEPFKIKRSKIRGEESVGMICSEVELGIGESHEGIMVLPEETKLGVSAREYFQLKEDYLFEIGLTPNRVDGASHWGVARDLYAYFKFNGIEAKLNLPSVEQYEEIERVKGGDRVEMRVDDKSGSPRYWGVTLEGIKIAPSPEWMQTLLKSIGVRPINNIVDITNFVLHEVGHPLHPFDADKLIGNEIVVRRANKGEKMVTLDEVERELHREDLMICDSEKSLCIGGVFGGLHSGVTEGTTRLFLESAYFDPISIRRSSRRHGLKTDASFRYERGADPDRVEYALKRAALLMSQLAGAKVVGEIVKSEGDVAPEAIVELNFERIGRFIGKMLSGEEILQILTLLQFEIVESSQEGATVKVPRFRVDVTRECDVVEEILRIYGYNNIELPERMTLSINSSEKPEKERVEMLLSNLLVNNGFYEIMSNSLTKSGYYEGLESYRAENLVRLKNPLSSDLDAMRQTLLFNGLEAVERNVNRQCYNLKLFEFGNVYSLKEGVEREKNLERYSEKKRVALFLSGGESPYWRGKSSKSDFYQLKGYLEALLSRLGVGIERFKFGTAPKELFSEGVTLELPQRGGAVIVGWMGRVSNTLLKPFDIKQEVYAAELEWSLLLTLLRRKEVEFKELPRFPEVVRDLALIVDESVKYEELKKVAFEVERKLLKEVTLFDVYRGTTIGEGKKQYAISYTLRDEEKTLTDKRVEKVMEQILKLYRERFGAILR